MMFTGGLRIESSGHCLWNILCRARTRDGSIPHSDNEGGQSKRGEDSLVNAVASTLFPLWISSRDLQPKPTKYRAGTSKGVPPG